MEKIKEKFTSVNKCGTAILLAVQVLRILAEIGFFILFAYWSLKVNYVQVRSIDPRSENKYTLFKALAKFSSNPISSSVNFWNGDDNKGNFEFPAITICLSRFSYLTRGDDIWDNKCRSDPLTFDNALAYCTDPTKHGEVREATTTTTATPLGNLFDDGSNDIPVQYFSDIQALMNQSHFDIADMIKFFQFSNLIKVTSTLDDSTRKEYLMELFQEFVHPTKGYCHTFDPKVQNVSLVPLHIQDEIQEDAELLFAEIDFQVTPNHILDQTDSKHSAF